MTLSAYIREAAINKKIVVKKSKWDTSLILQLRRIGVNINQQNRKLNYTGNVSPELQRLWAKLSNLLDHIIMEKDDTKGSREGL